MLLSALSFVVGAWCLQQQASLPSTTALITILLALIACSYVLKIPAVKSLLSTRHFPSLSTYPFIKALMYALITALLGFSWAALHAHYRLSDALPPVWEQKKITLIGVVASLPESTERGQRFNLDVEQILTPQAVVPKHISLNYYATYVESNAYVDQNLSQVKPVPMFHAGERWQLTVRLKRPHGSYNPHGFDFEAWALSENMRATGSIHQKSGMQRLAKHVNSPKYLITKLRAQVGARILQVLAGQPFAGVIRALVIGDDSLIAQHDWDIYLRTGTNHLMSISGLHITMLAGLVYALSSVIWRRIPHLVLLFPTKKAAAMAGMVTALLYAALAGFSVPTQRTLYMLMTVTLLLLQGRQLALSHILALALLVVVLIDPWAVIAPGFWLSFGAVAVMAFATGSRLARPHWLQEAVAAQWAVTLGLLPVLMILFGQFSLISPIANALAIPVISFVVVPLSILGSLLPLDSLLLWAHSVLQACMWGLAWLSGLPLAVWQQATPPMWALLLGVFGVLWSLLPKGVPLRWLGLVCLLPLFFPPVTPINNGDMQVTVLDVGQGLSVVVKTAKHTLLYDAGPYFTAQSDAGSRVVHPYLQAVGVIKLDAVIASHDDVDHTGGLASVLAQHPVNWFINSLTPQADLLLSSQYVAHAPQRQFACHAGQHWQWDGVTFAMLYPEAPLNDAVKDNDKSCVLKITSLGGSLLLTGDIEKRAELALLARYPSEVLNSDIMIAPHHGSKTSSSRAFIAAVAPQFAIVTNGYLNRFRHPKPDIVQRYVDHQAQVVRSDYDGAIDIQFEKNQPISLTTWRKAYPKYWHDSYP